MSTRSTALVLAILFHPAVASAHELWLERSGDELVLHYGHHGDRLAVAADRVRAMHCLDASGKRDVRASATVAPTELRVAARCEALSVTYDGGFWSLTPDGERNLPKSQIPDAVKSWASRQYAKWIDPRAPRARQPLGDELEIVPSEDLSRASTGDKVAVRVLHRGKPAAGATVSVGHKVIGETDSRGEVRLRIRSRQLETIAATLRRPLESVDADVLVLEANLSFEVAQ